MRHCVASRKTNRSIMEPKVQAGIAIAVIVGFTIIVIGILFGVGVLGGSSSSSSTVSATPSPTLTPTPVTAESGTMILNISGTTASSSMSLVNAFLSAPEVVSATVRFGEEQGVSVTNTSTTSNDITVDLGLAAYPLPLSDKKVRDEAGVVSGPMAFLDSQNKLWVAYNDGSDGKVVNIVKSTADFAGDGKFTTPTQIMSSPSGANQVGLMWEFNNELFCISCFGTASSLISVYGDVTGTTLPSASFGMPAPTGSSNVFGLNLKQGVDDPTFVILTYLYDGDVFAQVSPNGGRTFQGPSQLVIGALTPLPSVVVRSSTDAIAFNPRTTGGMYAYKYNGSWQGGTQIAASPNAYDSGAAYIDTKPCVAYHDSVGGLWFLIATDAAATTWEAPVAAAPVGVGTDAVHPIRVGTVNNFPIIVYGDGTHLKFTMNNQMDAQGTWSPPVNLMAMSGNKRGNAIIQEKGVSLCVNNGGEILWNWIPAQVFVDYTVQGELV